MQATLAKRSFSDSKRHFANPKSQHRVHGLIGDHPQYGRSNPRCHREAIMPGQVPPEIADEIQRLEDDDIFDHDMDLHSLEMDVEDDDEGFSCNWTFHCEPMFEGVPTMDELIEFDNRVKEIINSHKK